LGGWDCICVTRCARQRWPAAGVLPLCVSAAAGGGAWGDWAAPCEQHVPAAAAAAAAGGGFGAWVNIRFIRCRRQRQGTPLAEPSCTGWDCARGRWLGWWGRAPLGRQLTVTDPLLRGPSLAAARLLYLYSAAQQGREQDSTARQTPGAAVPAGQGGPAASLGRWGRVGGCTVQGGHSAEQLHKPASVGVVHPRREDGVGARLGVEPQHYCCRCTVPGALGSRWTDDAAPFLPEKATSAVAVGVRWIGLPAGFPLQCTTDRVCSSSAGAAAARRLVGSRRAGAAPAGGGCAVNQLVVAPWPGPCLITHLLSMNRARTLIHCLRTVGGGGARLHPSSDS